jgi:hypothetical protein
VSAALKWVKRPVPQPDESLAGFLSRWARHNHLQSRPRLLQVAGVPKSIRIKTADLEKLAAVLGLDQTVLLKIAPSTLPAYPALRRGLTRPLDEGVCPHCLEAASYSRQIWSHRLATACAEHGVRLVDRCGRCYKSLAHDRPLAHLCRCGQDLRLLPTEVASAAEVEFAGLLMGLRLPGTVFPFAINCDVPVDVDLFFLGLANQFGAKRGGAPQPKAGKSDVPASVVDARARLEVAFNLLTNWPHNFDARLQELMELPSALATTGVAKRLGTWYVFLFKRHTHPLFEPLRVAAANRIVLSHDGTLNARTRNVTAIATAAKSWYSVVESVEALGVSRDRVNDGIDLGLIEARVHDESAGYRQRYLHREEIERLLNSQLEHISDGSARKVLHVSKAIYRLMDEAGWIERVSKDSVAPVVTGLVRHVPLLQLIRRLKMAAAGMAGSAYGEAIPLRDLHLRRTTDHGRMVELYRSILTGEFAPIGDDGAPGLGGLLFSVDQVDARIASRLVSKGLTLQQISGLTSAHYDAVTAWVRAGLLPATQMLGEHGSPWVVELKDLIGFLLTYTPLASQARSSGSSSRGLAAKLGLIGVQVIETSGPRGALVKVSDLIMARVGSPARLDRALHATCLTSVDGGQSNA